MHSFEGTLFHTDTPWTPVLGACMAYLRKTGRIPLIGLEEIGLVLGWMNEEKTTRPEIVADFLAVFPDFFETWPNRLEYRVADLLLACHDSYPRSATMRYVAATAHLLTRVTCKNKEEAFVRAMDRYVNTVKAKTDIVTVFSVIWACETLNHLFSEIGNDNRDFDLQRVFRSPGFLNTNEKLMSALTVDPDARVREDFLKWLANPDVTEFQSLKGALYYRSNKARMGTVTEYIDYIYRHLMPVTAADDDDEPAKKKKIKNAAE